MNPRATIILGGPQASVVDVATMHAFPVHRHHRSRRSRRHASRRCCGHLATPTLRLAKHPGASHSGAGTRSIRNRMLRWSKTWTALPLPAFDLDARIKERGGVHLEIGRGCPFACTFCSTNDFFRRNFRLKSPAKMIEEISALKSRVRPQLLQSGPRHVHHRSQEGGGILRGHTGKRGDIYVGLQRPDRLHRRRTAGADGQRRMHRNLLRHRNRLPSDCNR